MTKGDETAVKCPACKKLILEPVKNHAIGSVQVEFSKPCPLCGVRLYFWARPSIEVRCEKEDKVI